MNARPVWSQTGGKGRQWSCRELLTETQLRVSIMDWRKCGDPRRRDLFTWNFLLNVPSDIDHEALDQRITKTSLDEIPTMDEMARAIAGLKVGKAPGGDGIPAEVWMHGGDNQFSILHQLITNAWEVGSVPQAWKDASIVTIYKKCERTDCGNYRGISLLCIASKIFARILINRLSTHITPEVVPETQCGFIGNRSTVDMRANVSVGGEVSESFSVTNGVKQGWVLAQVLLHLPISNARRGFPRHGGWRLHTAQTERWPIQRRTLQS